MTKKLLVVASIVMAAALTSCGNTDIPQDDSVVQQETSVTTTTVSTTETEKTKEVTSAPENETTTESLETVTEEITDTETATTTDAATTTDTTSAAVTTAATTKTIKKAVTTAAVRRTTTAKATTTKKQTPAEKVPVSTAYKNYKAPATELSTGNNSFPTVDTIILKASSLLGTPYYWGNKGYTGIYNILIPNKALTVAEINQRGIDCSGLVFYTLTQLGYKASGFMFNNPMPVDTVHWLSVNAGSVISYGDTSSKVDVEKKGLSTKKYAYWERADGSTITPGSIVVGENLYDDNHAWIYMGEFEDRNAVIAYLKAIGVPDKLINSKTVGNGKGSGGTHWRIESNGSDGVVINNNTEKENTDPTTYYIYAYRVTQKNTDFEIDMYNSDGALSGTSLIDKSSAVYGIYRDKACTSKIGEITIGSDGTGKLSLPPTTYYAKQLKSPSGYISDTVVHTIQAGKNKFTQDYQTRNISLKMTSEDGNVKNAEFELSWTRNGKTYSKTAKTDSNGKIDFSGLIVYDMSNGKAITYTVSMINTDTELYITPDVQTATLTKGDVSLSVKRKCVPTPEPEPEHDNTDSSTDDSDVNDDSSTTANDSSDNANDSKGEVSDSSSDSSVPAAESTAVSSDSE